MEDYQRKNAELERLVAEQTAELKIKNRELEVEAALERVRAASMAMQESSELPSVALVLVNQLAELNVQQLGSSIVILDDEQETYRQYSAHDNLKDQKKILNLVQDLNIKEIHFGREILRLARSGEKDFTIELRGEPLQEWMTYVKNKVHEQRGEAMLQAGFEGIYFHFALFHGVSSIVISTSQPLPDTDKDILRRMANTFGSSYLRYLDLQKAEAQVREARIEAALERVRGRTMAMRKSEELAETAFLMFHQLKELGLTHYNCGFVILNRDDLSGESWFSRGEVVNETVPWRFDIDPALRSVYEAWKKGSDFFEVDLSGEALERHYQNIEAYFRTLDFKANLMQVAEVYRTRIIGQSAFFSHGFLLFQFDMPNAETAILKRFARVFEQTYTRFLDLQKAEAFAMEKARQASLDRVRAEIASMRTTEDLERITPLIWQELLTLEVPFFRCGVFIINEDAQRCRVFLSTPEGNSLAAMELPFGSFDLVASTVQHWRVGQVYTREWDKGEFRQWTQSLIGQGYVSDPKAYQGNDDAPEHLALHFVPFTQGMLYVGSEEPLADEQLSLVQALADAFSVAFARYEDFRQLESAKVALEKTLTDLRATQTQLIQQEKLASLGQLTAGIAHEIKNPLNFVNNFADLSTELIDEVFEELQALESSKAKEEMEGILTDVRSNLLKIHEHGSRADSIVQAMLLHSRGGSGEPELTDLNAFVREYVNLAYHGMRAGNAPIKVSIDLDLDGSIAKVPLMVEDFGRVLLNLCQNAFDALRSKVQAGNEKAYQPKLAVRTRSTEEGISIEVTDNGPGIPEAIRDKVLQPFFTTKKGTEGTGLGLSISNDIVKAHGGKLSLLSSSVSGSTFIAYLKAN